MNYVRAKPRLNPRIEDDERELMEKGLDGNSEGVQEWQKLEGQDKGG
jgi:hypothetical protein